MQETGYWQWLIILYVIQKEYFSKKLKTYYSYAHSELVTLLPIGSQNIVLDSGSDSESVATCALIASDKKLTELWGVKKLSDAASTARKLCVIDKILQVDAEVVIKDLPKRHFTYFIAGNILEYLIDSWKVCADLNVI